MMWRRILIIAVIAGLCGAVVLFILNRITASHRLGHTDTRLALAEYYWHEDHAAGLRTSADKLSDILRDDPRNAEALALLATALARLAAFDAGAPNAAKEAAGAEQLARQAVNFDYKSARAHAALGYVLLSLDGDAKGAGSEFQQALDLDPQCATAHLWLGSLFLSQGELDQARAHLRRAYALDSELPSLDYLLASTFYLSRDYQRAGEFGQRALRRQSRSLPTYLLLAAVYDEAGRYPQAIAILNRWPDRSPATQLVISAALTHIYAAQGDSQHASQELANVDRLSKLYPFWPSQTAIAYAAGGRNDDAFAWLEQIQTGARAVTALDPRLDSLRKDPRFTKWLHERPSPSATATP